MASPVVEETIYYIPEGLLVADQCTPAEEKGV